MIFQTFSIFPFYSAVFLALGEFMFLQLVSMTGRPGMTPVCNEDPIDPPVGRNTFGKLASLCLHHPCILNLGVLFMGDSASDRWVFGSNLTHLRHTRSRFRRSDLLRQLWYLLLESLQGNSNRSWFCRQTVKRHRGENGEGAQCVVF